MIRLLWAALGLSSGRFHLLIFWGRPWVLAWGVRRNNQLFEWRLR